MQMATKGFSFGIHNRTRSSVSTSLKKVGSKTFNQGCRQLVLLLQERQLADDGGVLCFAAAYLEEADDAHDEENCNADSAGNRHNEREGKHSGNDEQQGADDVELQRLTGMERRVFALRCRKQCDDDADGAENVRCHGDDLILGDILRVELCGVICRVIRRLLGIDRLLVYGLLRVNRRLGLLLGCLRLCCRLLRDPGGLRLCRYGRTASCAEGAVFGDLCSAFFTKAINFYRPFAQIPAVDMPPLFRRALIFVISIIANLISVVNACQEILRKRQPLFLCSVCGCESA